MKAESMEARGVFTLLASLSFFSCLFLLGAALLFAFPARGATYEVTPAAGPSITVSPTDKQGQDTSTLDYSVSSDGVNTKIVVYLDTSLDGFSYLELYTTTSLGCGSTNYTDSNNTLSLSTTTQNFITSIQAGCSVTGANLTYVTELSGWSTSAKTYDFTINYEMQAV